MPASGAPAGMGVHSNALQNGHSNGTSATKNKTQLNVRNIVNVWGKSGLLLSTRNVTKNKLHLQEQQQQYWYYQLRMRMIMDPTILIKQ